MPFSDGNIVASGAAMKKLATAIAGHRADRNARFCG
jgi:hypothetical protein